MGSFKAKSSSPPRNISYLGTPSATLYNVNNISGWIRDDGWSAQNPSTLNAGVVYPRGTANVVFQDGLVWGGLVIDIRDTLLPRWRVGGDTYEVGTQPGWIETPGTPSTPPIAVDPNNARVRIYRLRADWQSLTVDDPAVLQDAAEVNSVLNSEATVEMAQQVLDQYALDWGEWPVDLGAPYIDENMNGTWDPGTDRPGILGADQVIWFVYNDLDTTTSEVPPIGLEVQATIWSYGVDGPFGQCALRRYRLINKSGLFIDSMHVSLWADPDLGDFGDDYAGCDTTLDMIFTYNSGPTDNLYSQFDLPPAVVGYALLQGPIGVAIPPNISPDENPSNLRMTAAYYGAAGDIWETPPTLFTIGGAEEWRNLFQGLLPNGLPFIYPGTSDPTAFWLDGDPVAGTGRIDGVIDSPGDRQIGLCSGPFTMADNDTQDIVIAIAGGFEPDGDYITAITMLKDQLTVLHALYDDPIVLPRVSSSTRFPSSTTTQLFVQADLTSLPTVTGSEVNFSPEAGTEPGFLLMLYDDGAHNDSLANDHIWGNSITLSNRKYPYKGDLAVFYSFEQRTNIYSGVYGNVSLRPSPRVDNLRLVWENGQQDSSINNLERVHLRFDVTNFDSLNDISSVRITNFAPGSSDQVVHYSDVILPGGTASADSLFLVLVAPAEGDSVRFFFETRFDYHTDLFDVTVPVVSWIPGPNFGDTLEVFQVVGPTDNVVPIIADESLLNGHTYLITFYLSQIDGQLLWQLTDQTTNEIRIEDGLVDTPPIYPHPVIDGIQYVVTSPSSSPDFKDFQTVANAGGPLVPPEGAAAGFQGFPSATPTDRQQLGPGVWLIHAGPGSPGTYSYFTTRVTRSGSLWNLVIQKDYEIRFTERGGWAWLAYTTGESIPVPFELWSIGRGTPDDVGDDYRMVPWLFDADADGSFDLSGDHAVSEGDDDPFTDWIYWEKPADTSAGEAGYLASEAEMIAGTYDGSRETEIMARIVLVNWNGGSSPPYNQDMPEQGTIFRIIPKKPNHVGDSLLVIAIPLSIDEVFLPSEFRLFQNYPNPFNPSTRIRFTLPKRVHARLEVYNVLGQRIKTLLNSEMQAGRHEVVWDGRNSLGYRVGSGVYFYRLDAGKFVSAHKMVLLK